MSMRKELWDASLTSKLVYLLKIYPVLSIKDTYIRDERLKEQYRHYDPLAIALKILEVIIDNMGPFMGITETSLITEICPLLEKMDEVMGLTDITHEEHISLIKNILDKLVYQKKEGIRISYTDYSSTPPEQLETAFRLVSYRNYDNENIVLHAETETVNFFLQMLNINLEDRQQAELFVLTRQIRRGDFQNALDSAKRNLRITKQYELKIQDIIHRSRRNLSEVDWHQKAPEELNNAKIHIKDCLDQQIEQGRMVTNYLENLADDKVEPRKTLIILEEELEESLNYLLPLQKTVNEARDVFLSEQWTQELLAKKSNALNFENDLLDRILPLEYGVFKSFIDQISPFFSNCLIPKNTTLDQLITLVFKNLNKLNVHPKLDKEQTRMLQKSLDLKHYPTELRTEAVQFIMNCLKGQKGEVTLDNLINESYYSGKSLDFCNYLKILIQGRYVESKFESKFLSYPLEIHLIDGELQNPLFQGNDYKIVLEGKNG